MKKRLFALALALSLAVMPLSGCWWDDEHLSDSPLVDPFDSVIVAKPVIYLDPETECDVSVRLDYRGNLTCTYPVYDGGWNVTAQPDGTLVDRRDGREYSYLFWEGEDDADYDTSEGFVISREGAADALQELLSRAGLTPREYNELIVYWLPRLQTAPYYLVTFQGERYTERAPLHITPEPDSILRVFLTFRPLEEPVSLPEQTITPFVRTGFTVVEWGGALLSA